MVLSESVPVNRQLEATDRERQPWIFCNRKRRSSFVRLTV